MVRLQTRQESQSFRSAKSGNRQLHELSLAESTMIMITSQTNMKRKIVSLYKNGVLFAKFTEIAIVCVHVMDIKTIFRPDGFSYTVFKCF